jgi:hypothetical protein
VISDGSPSVRYPPAVSIFTRRNAAVGYLTLKALDHRRSKRSGLKLGTAVGYLTLKALDRRRSKRSGLKRGLAVALGLISFGILAGVAAVAIRRRGRTAVGGQEEESAATDEAEIDDVVGEIVGEYVAAAPEPIPAT